MPPTLRPNFDRCFEFTLGREGGFVNDPKDRGGATNHGISLRYAVGKGRVLDLDNDGDVDEADIRLVTPAIARTLYRADFWVPAGCEGLPGPLGLIVFDSAVLCGPARAPRWLQQALGVAVDGKVGPKTLAAAGSRDLAETMADVLLQRQDFLREAPTFPAHGKGWLRRVMYLAMEAGVWAAEGRA